MGGGGAVAAAGPTEFLSCTIGGDQDIDNNNYYTCVRFKANKSTTIVGVDLNLKRTGSATGNDLVTIHGDMGRQCSGMALQEE